MISLFTACFNVYVFDHQHVALNYKGKFLKETSRQHFHHLFHLLKLIK
jgi:hypothetical protein